VTTYVPLTFTPRLCDVVRDPRNLDFARRLIDLFVETANGRRHT